MQIIIAASAASISVRSFASTMRNSDSVPLMIGTSAVKLRGERHVASKLSH